MPDIAQSAYDMISGMTPEPQPGVFVFIITCNPAHIAALAPHAISTFREAEGHSMIVPVDVAEQAGFGTASPMACITLSVYSSLEGVGLTAAVSAALGAEQIPCNMVAAFHHDHVFVPAEMCERAVQVLTQLQETSAQEPPQ